METQILDWNKYIDAAKAVSAEGAVLLKNDGALPYKGGTKLAVFGRSQSNYYKGGTGSGGMVNVDYVINIPQALKQNGIELNAELEAVYAEWEKSHPLEEGIGWGSEPWCQEEMPVSEELAERAARQSEAALVIIGRTAGEDKDNKNAEGSWLLTQAERQMLASVCKAFKSVTVLLNVGNIIDMGFVDDYKISAVLYAWQGGMVGAAGTADVLAGKTSPSGKLTDTIARRIEDYPSHANFGSRERDFYAEDIYVGYRYFETFAPEKVRYPFGFGLSYTTFELECGAFRASDTKAEFDVTVTNTGGFSGKEVVQIYAEAPQGLLGKPRRTLVAFAKTECLERGASQKLHFSIGMDKLASFDDTGKTGNKSCMVLESGTYTFYAGTDVRACKAAGSHELGALIITERLHQALSPVRAFERFAPQKGEGGEKFSLKKELLEAVPPQQQAHRNAALAELEKTYDMKAPNGKSEPLSAVVSGKITMRDFLAQLSDDDLACIIRGEGLGSPKVTAGTVGAIGGVNEHLQKLGVPCVCCTDGPSGLRLDSGAHAFSMPIGTLQACTFNPKIVEELYSFTGLELAFNKVEILLGPGMNIHRHPLCGRNFEYFSEDPLVTGKFGAAVIRGLHSAGVTGTAKHFCGNNQENGRATIDSVISERALREIYLRGFEIAVKEADADAIMTTYGSLNGTWTCSCYDLNTTILRGEWGFKGIAMTDWWAKTSDECGEPSMTNFAAMARAQNDLYMVCSDSSSNAHGDNTLEALKGGGVSRAELLRNAGNILQFAAKSLAQKRLGEEVAVTVVNRPASAEEASNDVQYYKLDSELVIPLDGVKAKKGSSYSFAVAAGGLAQFSFSITGKACGGELAQVPLTMSFNGIPCAMFTWNGDGKWKTIEQTTSHLMPTKNMLVRLYFAQGGLELKEIRVRKVRDL